MRLLDRIRPMQGYNFTERTRQVLAMSREEAARLDHEYVGTEHILLGLIREGGGVAIAVLQNLGVDTGEVRDLVDRTVRRGTAAHASGPDLPYTSRAKKVLELAMAEARELNHSYIGTEHVLLGLLREEKGIAAQLLAAAGARLEPVRAETLRLLGNAAPTGAPASRLGLTGGGSPPAVPRAPARSAAEAPVTHARAQEDAAWARLTRALDVTTRLGAHPTLALEADRTLTVSLGPDLVMTVELPPALNVRPRSPAPEPPPGDPPAP